MFYNICYSVNTVKPVNILLPNLVTCNKIKIIITKYNVSKKTVSRDINEIRSFLSEYRDIIGNAEIVYDRKKQKYHMEYYDYSVQSHSSTCDETKEDE